MINTPLTIAALPLDIKWADREANIRAVEEAAAALQPQTDVLVLPELFSTGFIADPDVYPREAETDSGPTLTRLRALAAERRIAIAGSFLARNDQATEYYNRGFFIEPNGTTTYVNKRHLFHVSPEAQILTAGQTPYPVVRFRGWNLALGVCYDLRFPVWMRNRMVRGRYAYDVFLLPSNWPHAREVALVSLAQARAIENQAYVIVANRSGSDEYGEYDGLTFSYDHIGTRIGTPSTAAEPVYTTTSRDELERLRQYMPAGLDSDTFSIDY